MWKEAAQSDLLWESFYDRASSRIKFNGVQVRGSFFDQILQCGQKISQFPLICIEDVGYFGVLKDFLFRIEIWDNVDDLPTLLLSGSGRPDIDEGSLVWSDHADDDMEANSTMILCPRFHSRESSNLWRRLVSGLLCFPKRLVVKHCC